jgi:hypothetical protein
MTRALNAALFTLGGFVPLLDSFGALLVGRLLVQRPVPALGTRPSLASLQNGLGNEVLSVLQSRVLVDWFEKDPEVPAPAAPRSLSPRADALHGCVCAIARGLSCLQSVIPPAAHVRCPHAWGVAKRRLRCSAGSYYGALLFCAFASAASGALCLVCQRTHC